MWKFENRLKTWKFCAFMDLLWRYKQKSADFIKFRTETETLLHSNVWWWIRSYKLILPRPPLNVGVEKLMNRISPNIAYTETYPKAMDTENLKYFWGLALSGKFDKVVKVKGQKTTQHDILSKFGLEALSHSIANFSVVKVWRETKCDYYVEETQTDISTKQLVSEKSEWRAIWNLLLPISNTGKIEFA